jgi:hypothetical protein
MPNFLTGGNSLGEKRANVRYKCSKWIMFISWDALSNWLFFYREEILWGKSLEETIVSAKNAARGLSSYRDTCPLKMLHIDYIHIMRLSFTIP